MTYEEAVKELEDAWSEGEAEDLSIPEVPKAESNPEETPTPEGSAAATEEAVAEAPAEDSFLTADLDALMEGIDDPAARAAVEGIRKSMQGDYTRKTQDLAAQRKALEELGDPAAIREALDFRREVQDPNNWVAMHAELTNALQELGLSPAEAEAVATGEPVEEVAPLPELDADDPETGPLAAHVKALQDQLNELNARNEREREELRREQHKAAVLGELSRQEAALRQANDQMDDDDMVFTYQLSDHFGNNLLQANEAAEAFFQRRLARYLEQKATVEEGTPIHVPATAGSEQPTSVLDLSDKERDRLAIEMLEAGSGLD